MQNDKIGSWYVSVPCGGSHHFLAVSADGIPAHQQPASVFLLPLPSGRGRQNFKWVFSTVYCELSAVNQCSAVK